MRNHTNPSPLEINWRRIYTHIIWEKSRAQIYADANTTRKHNQIHTHTPNVRTNEIQILAHKEFETERHRLVYEINKSTPLIYTVHRVRTFHISLYLRIQQKLLRVANLRLTLIYVVLCVRFARLVIISIDASLNRIIFYLDAKVLFILIS